MQGTKEKQLRVAQLINLYLYKHTYIPTLNEYIKVYAES